MMILDCQKTSEFARYPQEFVLKENIPDGIHEFVSENPWHGKKIATVKNGKLEKLIYFTSEKGIYRGEGEIYRTSVWENETQHDCFPILSKLGNNNEFQIDNEKFYGEETETIKNYFRSNFFGLPELSESNIEEIFKHNLMGPREGLGILDGEYYMNKNGFSRATIKDGKLLNLEMYLDFYKDYPHLVWYMEYSKDGNKMYR